MIDTSALLAPQRTVVAAAPGSPQLSEVFYIAAAERERAATERAAESSAAAGRAERAERVVAAERAERVSNDKLAERERSELRLMVCAAAAVVALAVVFKGQR